MLARLVHLVVAYDCALDHHAVERLPQLLRPFVLRMPIISSPLVVNLGLEVIVYDLAHFFVG